MQGTDSQVASEWTDRAMTPGLSQGAAKAAAANTAANSDPAPPHTVGRRGPPTLRSSIVLCQRSTLASPRVLRPQRSRHRSAKYAVAGLQWRKQILKQLALFERQSQELLFVTRLGVCDRRMEHPKGYPAVWQVRQRRSQSAEGALPLVQRAREARHTVDQQVCREPAEDAFVEQIRQQTAQFHQALGKIPWAEVAHGSGQDRHHRVLMELFVALEMLGLNADADRLQRLPQRPARRNGLCCKESAQKRAARQRFDPRGALHRRVEFG